MLAKRFVEPLGNACRTRFVIIRSLMEVQVSQPLARLGAAHSDTPL
ncbi:MAG: hypothetical protein DID90_2727552630 [Candidatus Nitrotoga sp. LAW]|nr:MAG: hypothetical protein DID90_2727552630 [Candidatus Nitrotoga sp. LAW]